MVNQTKKVIQKHDQAEYEKAMKQPMTRDEIYATFKIMLDDFKNDVLKDQGFILAQNIHFLNVLVKILQEKNIFTEKEFNELSQKLGEEERAAQEKALNERKNKVEKGREKKNKKPNRKGK